MGRPRKTTEARTLIAIESGIWTAPDGTEYVFRANETMVDIDHPLARVNPKWFTPVKPHLERPNVEEATAEPGVERGTETRAF